MKVGVISDCISQDLEQALAVIKAQNIKHVELQYVWDKEVGLHSKQDNKKIISLVKESNLNVTCLSTYALSNVPYNASSEDAEYKRSIKQLTNCFALADALGVEYVRTMGLSYQPILFGSGGAENFMTDGNKIWAGQVRVFESLATLAETHKQKLLLETCKASMSTTLAIGKKLMQELKSPYIQLLWDPFNALSFSEPATIETYKKYKKYIKHIHVKDGDVDVQNSSVKTTAFGKGKLKPFYTELSKVLREEKFKGGISLEMIYQPKGQTRYEGFLESWPYFKRCFLPNE